MKSFPEQPRFSEQVKTRINKILLIGSLLACMTLPSLWIAGGCIIDDDRGGTQTAGMECSLPNSQRLALIAGREPVPNNSVFSIEAFVEEGEPPHRVRNFHQVMFSQTKTFPWIEANWGSFDYPNN